MRTGTVGVQFEVGVRPGQAFPEGIRPTRAHRPDPTPGTRGRDRLSACPCRRSGAPRRLQRPGSLERSHSKCVARFRVLREEPQYTMPFRMQPRLVALLMVAIVSGVVAGFVGAGDRRQDAGCRPAGPAGRLRAVPDPGPLPTGVRARPPARRTCRSRCSPRSRTSSREFDPEARSAAGAARAAPGAALDRARRSTSTPRPPSENVLAGARYLRQLLDRFQSTELALAAYNAGPTAVEKAGGAPNAASLAYVDEVTRLWRSLNGCR